MLWQLPYMYASLRPEVSSAASSEPTSSASQTEELNATKTSITATRRRQLDDVTDCQERTFSDTSMSGALEKRQTEFHCHVEYSPLSRQYQHLDSENETPVTHPIKSLNDLLSWQPYCDPFSVPIMTLKGRVPTTTTHPRLMVCHDMMGGYNADRFVQGCPSDINYHIYHWHMISSFTYFSHHLVTIPPPGWTNAAHVNGVPVLGTFITEWDDGAVKCQKILESDSSYRHVANQLVAIAMYYKLDGWLVNIENNIRVSWIDIDVTCSVMDGLFSLTM